MVGISDGIQQSHKMVVCSRGSYGKAYCQTISILCAELFDYLSSLIFKKCLIGPLQN